MKRIILIVLTLFTLTGCIGPLHEEPKSVPDPKDTIFDLPSPPPESGFATYAVRVKIFDKLDDSISAPIQMHIDATVSNPKVKGGVAGSQIGKFPYDRGGVFTPFQFPFYLQPGTGTIHIVAEFTSHLAEDESISCWFIGPNGKISGTAETANAVITMNVSITCHANITA